MSIHIMSKDSRPITAITPELNSQDPEISTSKIQRIIGALLTPEGDSVITKGKYN